MATAVATTFLLCTAAPCAAASTVPTAFPATGLPIADLPALKDIASDDLELLRSTALSDLDFEVGQEANGAFTGEHCDKLNPLIQDRLRSEPSSLLASTLELICLRANATFIEFERAKTSVRLKMRQAERPVGEYFGETVVATTSMLDIPAYLSMLDGALVGDHFEVSGGGRRFYYVAFMRDSPGGAETTIRFDLSKLTTSTLRQLGQRATKEVREVMEDAPAAVMIAGMAAWKDTVPSALTGMAEYTANLPGNSWKVPEVRKLLSRAAELDNAYGRTLLARTLLLDHKDATAYGRAYDQLVLASKAGLSEADMLLSVMYEKGIGVAKNARSSREALARLVSARGPARADYLLSQLYLAKGSVFHDDARGRRLLERAALASHPAAQNEMGVYCVEHAAKDAAAKCMHWYREASAQGFAFSTSNLALNYENGTGLPRDLKKARELYQQASQAGLVSADSSLGFLVERTAESADDHVRASALYRSAAEWGSPWGQNNYAVNLREGNGVAKDEALSVRWFRLGALQGNQFAILGLANAYEWGIGVQQDPEVAAGLYEYTAAHDNSSAMVRLALMKLEGRGMDKDAAACRDLMTKAAQAGSSEAMWRLGEAARDGTFLERDPAIATQWLRKSAEAGDVSGKRLLGYLLQESSEDSTRIEGVSWLRQAAEAGDGPAMNGLGYALQNGIGTEVNLEQSRAWYQKGAAAGNAYAIYNLGNLKRRGLGEPKDIENAGKLFEKASGMGMDRATCELGNMLVVGEGMAQEPERGWKLVRQAADAGEGVCQLRMGMAYRYGNGSIETSIDSAKHYLELAAAQGLDDAAAQLAEISMRENPDDVGKIREGRATLTRLANTDSPRAQFLLAEACVLGRPWPRDMACARHYFELAGNGGFAAAASNLGLLFQDGLGGPPDLDAAESWYRKAIDLGASYSRYELGRLLLHKGKNIPEAIEALLAIASDENPGALYVLTRYCREHPQCPVPSRQRDAFRKQLDALSPNSKNVLAWGLAVDTMSDVDDAHYAIRLVQSLPEEKKKKWAVIDTLAAAHARAGEFDQASSQERKAIASMPKAVTLLQRKILEERLAFYEAARTWDLPY
jgi:TPR repeat protein